MYFPNRGGGSKKEPDDRYKSRDSRDRDDQRQNWEQNDRKRYDDRRESRNYSDERNYDDKPYDRSYDERPYERRRREERSHEERYEEATKRRSRSPMRRRRSPDPPSNKLILTSLPPNVDRDSMNIILSQHGFNPIDVRVIKKNNDSGGVRSFGFIDFSSVDEAKKYMRYTNGVLHFDEGFDSRIEFARENDPVYNADKKAHGSSDWFCAKCSINNFNRRDACFKCGTNRRESDALEERGYTHVGSQPCDTLLVRELPINTEEYHILSSLSTYSNVPIQRVHISNSKKYCFVQLRSVEDANYLLNTFNRNVPCINGCTVIVTFSLTSLNKILLTESVNAIKSQAGISINQVHQDPTNTAALLAQNALQLTQFGRVSMDSRQSISTPLGVFSLHSRPDPRVFQQDSATGYFYDSTTGFYFDPNTGFYFNNSVWCFWSTKFSTYFPVEGPEPELRKKLQLEERTLYNPENEGNIVETPETAPTTKKVVEEVQQPAYSDLEKKVKKSKKKEAEVSQEAQKPKTPLEIQKEMKLWAKKQEKIKISFKKPEKTGQQQSTAAKDLPFSTIDDDEDAEEIADPLESSQFGNSSRDINDSSSSDQALTKRPAEFNIQEYLDWNNLTCLLCQRQFKSSEILQKHCDKSELHQTNVAAKMKELGQTLPSTSANLEYRDRAKERRQKFGIDPGLVEKPEKTIEVEAKTREQAPLDDTNIGNRLLKNMGWSAGQGLGKSAQGIVNPISAEQRVRGVGLGAAGAQNTQNSYVSRKEQMKQTTINRYNNIRD